MGRRCNETIGLSVGAEAHKPFDIRNLQGKIALSAMARGRGMRLAPPI